MTHGEILVVDDEADLELLIRHHFRTRIAAGELKFHFAGDGEKALQLLSLYAAIDLVITDINMPVMDGLTLLRKTGELRRILKTVIVSAYDDMDNIRAAMNGGAYDFLTKPIDFADLEKTIAKSQRELRILRQGQQAQEQLSSLDHELRIATQLQQSILPEVITGDEFELAASMCAARQVSGDFYDFFLLDGTRLGLAIGDVSGKGVPAALFMAVSRTLLRATALHGAPPSEVLEHVNRVLLKQSRGEIYLTLLYGILDLATGEFTFSAGGHPPVFLCSSATGGRFLRDPRGLMLGVLEDATYTDGHAFLQPGDSLTFYTDGVTEAENARGEFYTERRLHNMLEATRHLPAAPLVAELLSHVRTFTEGLEQGDDITVLAVRFRPVLS